MTKKLASKASPKAPAKKPVAVKKVVKAVAKKSAKPPVKASPKTPAKTSVKAAQTSGKKAPVKPAAAQKAETKPAKKIQKAPVKVTVVEKQAAKPTPPPAKIPVEAAAKSPAANPVPAAKPSAKALASAAKPNPQVKIKRTTPSGGTSNIDFAGSLSDDDLRAMPESDYMNDVQLEFFRQRLIKMREEVLARELDVKERLHQREVFADPADRATAEEEHWLDLRLRERESMLMRKLEDSLRRIRDKEYGYCTKTGEPIGIPRLLARPTATVIVDVKGQDEKVETHFRDR